MLEELQRRNFSPEAIRGYLGAVERSADWAASRHFGSVPTKNPTVAVSVMCKDSIKQIPFGLAAPSL